MTIETPRALWLLLIILPVALIQLREYFRGRRDLASLATQWPRDQVQNLFLVKWFLAAVTFDICIALSVLAIADITWGDRSIEEERRGLDVVVALDISRSMLVQDVEPSRLSRSVSVARSVVRQLLSARVGLVVFKGDATTLVPLTADINALEIALDGVTPALISAPGTNLEAGLGEALRRFPSVTYANRAVILFSDGESLSGDPARIGRQALDAGIPIFTVVAGTAGGGTIPLPNGLTIEDEDGRPVISRAVGAPLETLSVETRAESFVLDAPSVVTVLVEAMGAFADRVESDGYRIVPARRYRLFAAAALVSLLFSISARVVRWRDMF